MDADRRRRFVTYVAAHFKNGEDIDRAKLIKKTKLTKGRISQFFDEDQPFGERAARSLAERLGLRPDYFERDAVDIDLTHGFDRDTLQFAANYQKLDSVERQRMRLFVMAAKTGHSAKRIKPAPSSETHTSGDHLGGESGLTPFDAIKPRKGVGRK